MPKYYWRLRELMAKYGLSQSEIAKIAGISEVSLSKKLNTGQEFKITPAYRIITHFRNLGENVNFEELFCAQLVTKVTDYSCAVGD